MQQRTCDPADRADVVARYVAAWGEADEAKRSALLRASCEPHLRYCDPGVFLQDRAELNAHLAELQRTFPGCRVAQDGEVEAYGSVARFRWQWSLADGTVRRRGVDFVRFSGEGRLEEVVGFFDPL
ncbi:nuclear transport factor 2 family protein [Ramlibacter sp. AN1015]|uniref:nuclear transport factor 2 family protein n=1 Tax=Ramlibacter sp. AN1015 TaxID=3133428 RepID=UPI0030C4C864